MDTLFYRVMSLAKRMFMLAGKHTVVIDRTVILNGKEIFGEEADEVLRQMNIAFAASEKAFEEMDNYFANISKRHQQKERKRGTEKD